jgi:hypothetical protein
VAITPNLGELIDRLRRLVEELEGVINDLWGLSVRCNSRKVGAAQRHY